MLLLHIVLLLEACSIVTAMCYHCSNVTANWIITGGMQYCCCGLIACVYEEYSTALGRRHGTISITVSANVLSLEACSIITACDLGCTHLQRFQGHHQDAGLGDQRDLDSQYFRIMIPQGVTAHLWCGLNQ